MRLKPVAKSVLRATCSFIAALITPSNHWNHTISSTDWPGRHGGGNNQRMSVRDGHVRVAVVTASCHVNGMQMCTCIGRRGGMKDCGLLIRFPFPHKEHFSALIAHFCCCSRRHFVARRRARVLYRELGVLCAFSVLFSV